MDYHYELYKINKDSEKMIALKRITILLVHYICATQMMSYLLLVFIVKKNDYRYKGVCLYNINSNKLTIINKKFSPFFNQLFNDKYNNGIK